MSKKAPSIPINVQVTSGGEDAPPNPKDVGPLFDFTGERAEEHSYTRVYRMEPVDEGHLDDLPADGDRKDIKRRWGGGMYKVQACTARGRILATDGNVKISGDPIFENEVGRKRYEKWLEQQFGKPEKDRPQANAPDPVAVEEARHQREVARIREEASAALARAKAEVDAKEAAEERRRQREREERRAEADERESREEARRRQEREERAEERRQEREAREREAKERMELEERRRQDEDRRWKAELEERRQEREARGDPMAQFAAMAQIFGALQGSQGPDDPVTALISRLPETLEQIRETGKEIAVASSASKGTAKTSPRRAGDFDPEKDVAFKGPIANELRRAVVTLQKAGKTPEQIERALAFKFRELAGVKPPAGHLPPRRTPPKKVPPKKAAPAPAPKAQA